MVMAPVKLSVGNKESKTKIGKRTTPQIHPTDLENNVKGFKYYTIETYHDETGKVPSWFN